MTSQAVLILADNQININEPAELIRDDFPALYPCTDVKTARELLDAHQPTFIIFNHDSLKTSYQRHQTLFPNGHKTSYAASSTLLLCQAREVHAAYKLCQQGLFDDYIVFKPLYDPYRLKYTLHSLNKALAHEASHSTLQQQLTKLGQDASELHRAMEQSIEHSKDTRQQAQTTYNALKDAIIEQVLTIPAQLASSKWQDAIKVMSPEVLKQRLKDFTEQRISQKFQQTEAELHQVMELWVDNVSTELARGIEFLEDVEIASNNKNDAPVQNKKILIVEDDEIYSSILQSILEEVGFHVLCEADGNKGLKRMAVTQPDYVLLDYELPDMTGLDFLKTVKKSNLLQHIPIIMLTGHNDRELVKKSILGGAKAFIIKPANREIILSKLQTLSTRSADKKA